MTPNPTDPELAAALLVFATARLADGRTHEGAFCDLVALGTDRRLAAVAVCAAAGTAWEVARARMAGVDDGWLAVGPAADAGTLLETYGYFDVEVELDPSRSVIASHLRQAMAGVSYLPGPYANQLYRLLRTGRVREAFLSLEETGGRRWADDPSFWGVMALAAAGLDTTELLDVEVAAARRRCLQRMA